MSYLRDFKTNNMSHFHIYPTRRVKYRTVNQQHFELMLKAHGYFVHYNWLSPYGYNGEYTSVEVNGREYNTPFAAWRCLVKGDYRS